MNSYRVSLYDLNRWPWELPIHHGDQCLVAQVCHLHLGNLHMCMFQQFMQGIRGCLIVKNGYYTMDTYNERVLNGCRISQSN
jgi:hypothetical protein